MIEFEGDDKGYLQWMADNQDGFVLNVRRRRRDSEYVVLHRAACRSIVDENRAAGAYTERGYRKICATDRASYARLLNSKVVLTVLSPSDAVSAGPESVTSIAWR
jgi:hypothetical protein